MAEVRPDLEGSTGVDLVSCSIGYILPMVVAVQFFR